MTGQEIFDAAVSWSLKEAPDGVTLDPTEATGIINRSVDGLFLFGSRFNPAYFGVSAAIAGVAGVWAFPSTQPPAAGNPYANLVFYREVEATGEKLHVVPIDQRAAAHPLPAVYLLGRTYVTAGNANDPTGTAQIRLFYARAPVPIANLAGTVDTLLPDTFMELGALETAMHAAIKDSRMEEADRLRPIRDTWALRWGSFLESISVGETRLHDHQFQTPVLTSLESILAGGSNFAAAEE